VTRSDEDRILRACGCAVGDRTHQCLSNRQRRPVQEYLSFKIESQQLRELPCRSRVRIFVFSRAWRACICAWLRRARRHSLSDRREDFRTEVLGLMKAQQVKNTVIVPWRQGGFVVKRMPSSEKRSRPK